MTTETDNINVRVAEAMGYAIFSTCDIGLGPQLVADVCPGQDVLAPQIVPRYTTDETTAMTLCERLKDEGWECDASSHVDGWTVSFSPIEMNKGVHATEATLALAICKAFLAVISSK